MKKNLAMFFWEKCYITDMIYLKVCLSAYKILRESCVGQMTKHQNNNASSYIICFKNQHRL